MGGSSFRKENKRMNHQYICKSCGKHITLPNGSKYCPICSGKVESKAEIYAKEKIKELQELLPVLESKYNEFAEMYAQFKITMCDANIELAVTSDYNKIVNVNDFTYFKRKEPMF